MTFNPANPPNAESPALFPAENRTNMLRLQTLFGADHQFNASAATNDGWHKIVHWVEQSGLIDPLNPTAAAPSNAGGPSITWEQQDTYNVPRPWFRLPNSGNVISMMGLSEIRVTDFSVTTTEQALVTPPDNTEGIIFYVTALGAPGFGTYWKSGGIVRDMSLIRQEGFGGTQTTGLYVFGTSGTQAYITVRINAASSPANIGQFRILYRYL